MATHQFTLINTRIRGVPFEVLHVYSTKKEFKGRSHLLASSFGGEAYEDKIYHRLTDSQAKRYALRMLNEVRNSYKR
jgi:hypothetical protein